MKARLLLCASVLLLAMVAVSCAVSDGQGQYGSSAYSAPPPAPARVGLPVEYRVFYDELADEGDWVLIEPYGWCFRPRVNFVAWRPYQEGWWEPSDEYGWVWTSTEQFGGITYHYGAWFYDEFQGWVWQPGLVWGPAWVAWTAADDYVGWAPLAPSQYTSFDLVPGGVFTYARANQFATREVGTQSLYVDKLPATVGALRPILSIGHADGVAFNRGPDRFLLQSMGAAVTGNADLAALPRIKTTVAPRANESDLLARTSRATAEAQRELRAFRDAGRMPPPVPASLPPPPPPTPPVFKPQAPAPAPTPPAFKPQAPALAPPDSAHAHRHPRAPADSTRVKPKPKPRPKPVAHPSAERDSTRSR